MFYANAMEHLRCLTNIIMEDCIKENVKVVEEFVDDEVAKVEIDNKAFLGSFDKFFDRKGHFFT